MEVLKQFEEICKPDNRHRIYGNFDPDEELGEQGDSLRGRHTRMARLDLSHAVPEAIRSAYAVARTLWLYGWFYWPFYTVAELHACLCVDLALYQRGVRAGLVDPTAEKAHEAHPALSELFEMALDQGWLTDEGFEHLRVWRKRAEALGMEASDETAIADLPDSDRYIKLLAEAIPRRRNLSVHPSHYWHGMPSDVLLQNTRDIIEQLFD
jgi:hypothetical protein